MKDTAQATLMEGLRAVWNRENLPEGVFIIDTPGGARIHFTYTVDIPSSRRQANLERLRQLPQGITRISKDKP